MSLQKNSLGDHLIHFCQFSFILHRKGGGQISRAPSKPRLATVGVCARLGARRARAAVVARVCPPPGQRSLGSGPRARWAAAAQVGIRWSRWPPPALVTQPHHLQPTLCLLWAAFGLIFVAQSICDFRKFLLGTEKVHRQFKSVFCRAHKLYTI